MEVGGQRHRLAEGGLTVADLIKTLSHKTFAFPLVAALVAFYLVHKALGG